MHDIGLKGREAQLPAVRRRLIAAYAFALAIPPLLLLPRILAWFPSWNVLDSLLLLLPVLLCSFGGGYGPGLTALLLSAACSAYLPHGPALLVFSSGAAGIAAWAGTILTGALGMTLIGLLERRNRGMERDRNDRNRLQETLLGIASSAPVILYAFRLDEENNVHFSYISPAIRNILGVTVEEVVKDPDRASSMIHSDDLAQVKNALLLSARTQQPRRLEFRVHPSGKKEIWIESSSVPHREPDGGVAWYGTMMDITDRKAMEAALKESEERFKTVFRSNPLPFALSQFDTGVFLDANEAFLKLLGYRREEIIGHGAVELGIWADPKVRGRLVEQLRGYGEAQETATRFVTKRGEIRDVIWSTTKLSFGGQDVLLGILHDQTDRLRAEREVRAWRERYERISEAGRMIFYDACPDQGRIQWSRGAIALLGIEGETERQSLAFVEDRIHPEDRERMASVIRTARERSESFDIEHRFRGADGSYLTFRNRGFSMRDEGSGLLHIVGVAEDFTERQRAQETLRLMAHAVESIAEGVTLTDLSGNLTFVNRAFRDAYGYEPQEVLGRDVSMLWSPGNPPELLATLRAAARNGPWKGDILGLAKDGREFPVALRISQIRDEKGEIVGYAAVHEDITERRHLEDRLLQAHRLEAVGRLAGGVAHDFNNMIGVIIGFASLLSEKIDPADPMHGDVEEILSAAQRSANITRQLLAFARKQVVAPVPLDLNQAVQSLRKVIQRLIGEDVALRIGTQDGLWTVKIDPAQVDQILANLASSARDSIRDVGTVFLGTSNAVLDPSAARGIPDGTPGEYVVLQFSDTGRGMDPATRAQVFEPFHAARPQEPGTGLGLATVFGIVKQNNGFLSVESEVDRGTTFKLYFPRHIGETEGRAEAAGPAASPEGGGETILLVEDEELLLELARKSLQKSGYTVLAVRSPHDAIALCRWRKEPIDLLLTDVIMPEMNGKDMNAAIQAVRPGLKTLFMSGYPADVIAERGFLEEGIQFIQKPFKPSDLAKKVRQVLGGA